MRLGLVLAVVAGIVCMPADAGAQRRQEERRQEERRRAEPSPAEAAQQEFDRGRFTRAIRRLEQALEAESLTREEYLGLIELRARCSLAIGRTEAMEQDARILAALDPGRELDETIRPELREAFEASLAEGAPLAVAVDVERGEAEATLTARAENAPDDVVRAVRVAARAGAAWETGDDGTLTVAVADTETLAYYAEALGPAGAVVARLGSEDAPQTSQGRAPLVQPEIVAAPPETTEEGEGPDVGLIVGLSAGGAALLVGIVVLAVVLAGGSERTEPTQDTRVLPPMLTVWEGM